MAARPLNGANEKHFQTQEAAGDASAADARETARGESRHAHVTRQWTETLTPCSGGSSEAMRGSDPETRSWVT